METKLLSDEQVLKASEWMKKNFGNEIYTGLKGTRYTESLVIAIACQETAYRWVHWIDKYPIEEVLAKCVFDASGDYPGTHRTAFPKNVSEFHDKYGDDVTQMLIDEGNVMRGMPQPGYPNGYGPGSLLYKGYGIFQYDLQNILQDSKFFLEKQWGNFNECIKRLVHVLEDKAKTHRDLWSIIKAYNGGGVNAVRYANNVFDFNDIINGRLAV